MMKCITITRLATAAVALLVLLTACENNGFKDPTPPPLEKRRVLLLDALGNVYDQTGALVAELPNCDYATQIIADGKDWFVSGIESNGRIGYWKNAKWNTLHVDDLEDVDHWIYGMGKWDSYMYLLDYPKVLKNSGIFRIKGSEYFIPADQALAVTWNQCYVVGSYVKIGQQLDGTGSQLLLPVYYYLDHDIYVPEFLPLPSGFDSGMANAIYGYGGDRIVICGMVGNRPVVWVDKKPQLLSLSFQHDPNTTKPLAAAKSVAVANGVVYVGGYEYSKGSEMVATLWRDGVPIHLHTGDPAFYGSEVQEVVSCGDDIYVLTNEYGVVDEDSAEDLTTTILWFNGTILTRFTNIVAVNIAVM